MSVLVSSVLSAHVYSNTRRTSGNVVVSAFEQMPLNMENDQVPSGVVNSMKQRLLDKFSESLVVNTRPSGSKSSNFSSLKHTTRLSRSQDSLLNDHSESLATFLQPKQNVIIVDTTVIKDEHIRQPRSAHSELHVDEVPKPGTVSTVKNMFERQIRLSRSDQKRTSSKQRDELRSSTRSRSISPNDMALRQRRTAASLPVSTSYPDLIISHTPVTTAPTKEIVIKAERVECIESDRPTISSPSNQSSDTIDSPRTLDFKSRLALFNGANSIKQSDEHLLNSNNSIKPSQTSPSSFLTKPVVHRHQVEKPDPLSLVQTAKSVTFFGGTKVTDYTQLILSPAIEPLQPVTNIEDASFELFDIPEFIGGNVKLNKSSIFSGNRKETRVQFMENIDTFEYPPLAITFSEDESNNSNVDDDDDDEFEQMARINAEFTASKLPEKSFEPKGTLQTFRPSNLHDYQLGSQHTSIMSDRKNSSTHSKSTTDIPWSSISNTTADLLF